MRGRLARETVAAATRTVRPQASPHLANRRSHTNQTRRPASPTTQVEGTPRAPAALSSYVVSASSCVLSALRRTSVRLSGRFQADLSHRITRGQQIGLVTQLAPESRVALPPRLEVSSQHDEQARFLRR